MTTTLTRPSAPRAADGRAAAPGQRGGQPPPSSGAYFFIPGAALFAVFFIYPLVSSFIQSFQSISGGETSWVGARPVPAPVRGSAGGQSLFNVF